tara:strand:- start:12 stop:569 length:558 start_codon:yes stop_codon:yes gene_type:complete
VAITRISGANAISGTIPAANVATLTSSNLPTGTVLQTVSGISTYVFSSSSLSYTDIESSSGTTWETAITLSSTSNKVLILPSVHIYSARSGHNEFRTGVKMLGKIGSGSYAQIGDAGTPARFGGYDYGGSGGIVGQSYAQSFLWSPSSTDELKVKFQVKVNNTSAGVDVSPDNYRSVVNLLEIQG